MKTLPHPRPPQFANPLAALRAHYPLYLMEGAELAIFMISACVFDMLLYNPEFAPIHNPWLTRLCMGASMGVTALLLIKCPWGKKSGAQFNPAITATFYRLGKIGPYDAAFYVIFHFLGGIAGVELAWLVLGSRLADPHVNFVVTVPGLGGPPAAFAAEFFMSAVLMLVVLYTSNRKTLAGYTPYLMATLITSYVVLFAPVSGFSMNPARTVGSAVFPPLYSSLWIYFVAPTAAMLLAAELYLRVTRPEPSPPGGRHYLTHRHLIQRNPPL
jgi:aquaporin Z